MNETAARNVTAVRALETSDRDRAVWSDDDRAAASRDSARVVGASAPREVFLATRAALALERLGERHPAFAATVRAFAWRPWIAPAILALAFVTGFVVDRIGGEGRINLLAPPFLALLAWNFVVYVVLAVRALTRRRASTSPEAPGALRRALTTLATRVPAARAALRPAPVAAAVGAFASVWTARAAPLYAARAARILHGGAALFAAGVIAGLYVRGLAFEYRATWESTFLTPDQVRGLLAAALAPGTWLTGIAVPDVAHLASIRSGAVPGSENAAPWLHLYAATLLLAVIVPRAALALVDFLRERRRASAFALPLDDPYFRRLARGFEEGPYRIRVVPYSFTLAPAADEPLRALLRRAFGAPCEISVAPVVDYGGEDALSTDVVPDGTNLAVALFNAVATPEPASHGAFVAALAAPGRDVVAVVDESALRARWPGDDARLADRRKTWREVLSARGAKAVFVTLAQPDLAAAEAALHAATAQSGE
jgi:hypothetical protein